MAMARCDCRTGKRPLWVIHVFPAVPVCPVHPESGHSMSAFILPVSVEKKPPPGRSGPGGGRRPAAMAKTNTAAGEMPLLDVVHVLRQVNVIECPLETINRPKCRRFLSTIIPNGFLTCSSRTCVIATPLPTPVDPSSSRFSKALRRSARQLPGERDRGAMPHFTAWAGGFTRFTGTIGFISMIPKIVVSFYAMRRYLERQLEVARESGGEGLIAELVRVEKNGGQISRNEMVSMVFLLLFAGHETTLHCRCGRSKEHEAGRLFQETE